MTILSRCAYASVRFGPTLPLVLLKTNVAHPWKGGAGQRSCGSGRPGRSCVPSPLRDISYRCTRAATVRETWTKWTVRLASPFQKNSEEQVCRNPSTPAPGKSARGGPDGHRVPTARSISTRSAPSHSRRLRTSGCGPWGAPQAQRW